MPKTSAESYRVGNKKTILKDKQIMDSNCKGKTIDSNCKGKTYFECVAKAWVKDPRGLVP